MFSKGSLFVKSLDCVVEIYSNVLKYSVLEIVSVKLGLSALVKSRNVNEYSLWYSNIRCQLFELSHSYEPSTLEVTRFRCKRILKILDSVMNFPNCYNASQRCILAAFCESAAEILVIDLGNKLDDFPGYHNVAFYLFTTQSRLLTTV